MIIIDVRLNKTFLVATKQHHKLMNFLPLQTWLVDHLNRNHVEIEQLLAVIFAICETRPHHLQDSKKRSLAILGKTVLDSCQNNYAFYTA